MKRVLATEGVTAAEAAAGGTALAVEGGDVEMAETQALDEF